MSGLKVLAKETAIYGLSSILGKLLSWCLFPIYTYVFASTSEMGEITNIYAWTGLLLVILTYGMETGFFRFINKKECNETTVYSTTLISLGFTSTLFVLLVFLFIEPISIFLKYGDHPEYILIMAVIVALDAFNSIPFAYLRQKKRPVRFMILKLIFIAFNIFFNLFFLIVCPYIYESSWSFLIDWFYQPGYNVGYVLISNLLAVLIQTTFVLPCIFGFKYVFDGKLLKQMLRYSFPLLILGIAGIMNQTFDRQMMPFLMDDIDEAWHQLGVYGTVTKIAVVLVMFTQAFRYAYEPFVFGRHKQEGENSTQAYADAMKYFFICSLFIFLGVCFYVDILQYIISSDYREGLPVLPIVMCGEIFMGIYFNLSIWYKLNDETRWGAYFSLLGFAVMAVINILFVPEYGYYACAWGVFFSYLVMMLVSFLVGRKRFPINYDLKTMGRYALLTILLFGIGYYAPIENIYLRLGFRTVLLLLFLLYLVKKDLPLKDLPYVNRYFKKE